MMGNSFKEIMALCLLLILIFAITGCDSSETESIELNIQITSPEDNAELRVNVVKVTGTVSDENATVTVNGIEVDVIKDGSFCAYLDIPPGDNTIKVIAVCDNEQVSQIIKVNFTPALAVYLESRDKSPNINAYVQSPFEVKGFVTVPQATVTINGSPVQVAEDGNFTHIMQLTEDDTVIHAIATFGEEKDEDYWAIGGPGVPRGLLDVARDYPVDDTRIKSGETISVDKVLVTGRLYEPPSYPLEHFYSVGDILYNPVISEKEYDEEEYEEIEFPKELNISIEPAKFTTYANTEYHTTITIETTADLKSGQYLVKLKTNGGTQNIIINVED